ncbi:MAG: RimK domain protein ATP-grasp [Deltaproteobacteria bacterium]|nr:RimK domain protein ATP-grasp [Deltaproteobacteria bacterium]
MTRILLIGYGTESTFSHFRDFLTAEGIAHEVLDLSTLREAHDLTITESAGELIVSIDDEIYHLSEYTAIYARCFWFELGSDSRNRALQTLVGALIGFLEHTPAIVINRPSSGASNGNKLAHLGKLSEAGLLHPEAHVIGDPALAKTIVAPDGSWISKSVSGIRTRAVALDDALFARLDRLVVCPSLFQRRIRGADVRVHVVGGECIAERIVAQQVDYRYSEPGIPRPDFSPCGVPPDVERACIAYCDRNRMMFAGIDFKIADDGTWYCLEVNPMPGYEPYDRRLGRRISRALAKVLTRSTSVEADLEPFVVAARRPTPTPFA